MAAGYLIGTEGGAIALSAATAKTILNVINASNSLVRITEIGVFFDGVTSSAVPVLVELCRSTQATAGTSSSATIKQTRGAARTVQATGAYNYTAEPTVLTFHRQWLVPAFMGSLIVQFPLGREPEQVASANGLAVRVTAPATVNVRGYVEFEEG